jgi:ATP-binding cassette subfamily B protein
MKSIAKYIKPYWGVILLTMLIKLLASLGELWIPSLMEVLLRKDTLSGGTGLAYFYGGLMILCAAFSLTLNILSNRMSAKSSGKITQSIRHDLFQKLQSLSSR